MLFDQPVEGPLKLVELIVKGNSRHCLQVLEVTFLAKECSSFVLQLSLADEAFLACAVATDAAPVLLRGQMLVATRTEITRLILLFCLFDLAVENLEDNLGLGKQAISLVALFGRQHLGIILLREDDLLQIQDFVINVFLCESYQAPFVFVDHPYCK